MFGKQKALRLLGKICKLVFGRLWTDMLAEVLRAECLPNTTGSQKAKAAIAGFILAHDEFVEWRWLTNALLEIAVGELKLSSKVYRKAIKTDILSKL